MIGCDQSGYNGNGTNIPEKIKTSPNVSCVTPSPVIVHNIVTFKNVVIVLLNRMAAHIETKNAAAAAQETGGDMPITTDANLSLIHI